MNKMFLRIMAILGLIAFAGADAMQRVDSPGVAQRKLNLLIKNAKEMTESEKQQALADLSPSLKADYEDALSNMPVRDRKNFETACAVLVRPIDEELLDNKEKLDELARGLIREFKLTTSEGEKLKDFAEKYFENHKGKGSTSDKDKNANDKLLEHLKQIDKEETNLSSFLQKLKEYFDNNLNDTKVPYKVTNTNIVKNRFDSGIEEYRGLDSLVNNFFISLSKYKESSMFDLWSDNFETIQDAFIKYLFPLINELSDKLSSSSDLDALKAASDIIDKVNLILDHKIKDEVIKTRMYKDKKISANGLVGYGNSCINIIKKYNDLLNKSL